MALLVDRAQTHLPLGLNLVRLSYKPNQVLQSIQLGHLGSQLNTTLQHGEICVSQLHIAQLRVNFDEVIPCDHRSFTLSSFALDYLLVAQTLQHGQQVWQLTLHECLSKHLLDILRFGTRQ